MPCFKKAGKAINLNIPKVGGFIAEGKG